MHKQGWLQLENTVNQKLIQTLVRASRSDWSWSQCIKSHHAQTSSGKGLPSHFWTRDNVRSVLPGLWRKRTQWSKVLFSDESKFCISFGNKVSDLEEEWRCTESMLLEVQCEVSQSVMIWAAMSSAGVDPLCFLKSTVNAAIYQEILEHFMLPSADKLMEMLISFSSRTWHLPTLPKVPKAGSMTMVFTVLDWPANSPDLNPIENL